MSASPIEFAVATSRYVGPIHGAAPNPAAHGGVCFVDVRRADRFFRLRNVNGSHEEIGPWRHPTRAMVEARSKAATS